MPRRMLYIHERRRWPDFGWDEAAIGPLLAQARHAQGRLLGRMDGIGLGSRTEAVLATMTEDVLKTSEIEGEHLNPDQVHSSLARRLGVDIGALKPADRQVEGIVEMTLDATQNYAEPLTQGRLFNWHAALFPTGGSGMRKIIVGAWRKSDDDPMQVVSGSVGRERVHFEAPPAQRLGPEMRRFLKWCNSDASLDPVLKAGIAHLWFVTIHPFADGNGRIARAIADLMLARSEQSSQRFYSMSAEIRAHRKTYYDILEATQKGDLDITGWLDWFLRCLTRSIGHAQSTLAAVLFKARFWENPETAGVNHRQRLMLNKLLDGFEGKLTTKKWATLTKTSHDTALRDIEALIAIGFLRKDPAGGRSTSYSLVGQPSRAEPQ